MGNRKGFILVETVVVAALMSMFLAVLFEMLIMFKGVYNRGESSVEMQENAQMLQQFVETRMYLCSKMIQTRRVGKAYKDWEEFEGGEIKELIFSLDELDGKIYINNVKKKLFYSTKPHSRFSFGTGYEFADYVKSMDAYKLGEGRGIRMVFELEKGDCSMDVDFNVYFRNARE